MLSVYSTLEETLLLWVRNFWYLVVLTLGFGTPIILLAHYGYGQHPAHKHLSGLPLLLGLVSLLSSLVLIAGKAAAILGLLRRRTLGQTMGTAVWSNIKNYTWTLFRLNILIGLIAGLVEAGIVTALIMIGVGKTGLLIGSGFYLVLIKYALADPLVVVENLKAVTALQRSWEMTKGHFWYVGGCYLFLGLGEWLIHWVIGSFPSSGDAGFSWAWLSAQIGLSLIDSLWIILSWCMYLRIKETDEPPLPEAIPL